MSTYIDRVTSLMASKEATFKANHASLADVIRYNAVADKVATIEASITALETTKATKIAQEKFDDVISIEKQIADKKEEINRYWSLVAGIDPHKAMSESDIYAFMDEVYVAQRALWFEEVAPQIIEVLDTLKAIMDDVAPECEATRGLYHELCQVNDMYSIRPNASMVEAPRALGRAIIELEYVVRTLKDHASERNITIGTADDTEA